MTPASQAHPRSMFPANMLRRVLRPGGVVESTTDRKRITKEKKPTQKPLPKRSKRTNMAVLRLQTACTQPTKPGPSYAKHFKMANAPPTEYANLTPLSSINARSASTTVTALSSRMLAKARRRPEKRGAATPTHHLCSRCLRRSGPHPV